MNPNERFNNLDLPEVRQASEYKKRFRAALLLAHENRSPVRVFGRTVNDFIQSMSKLQKITAFSALAVALAVAGAGFFGPSAFSVAHAEAEEVVNRAFVKIANLSDEERAALEERFQNGMRFKMEAHGEFMGLKDFSLEEMETRHEEMKASLAGALAEAKAAADLQMVSADELPVPGFFGRAGRTFGFKMMHKPENLEEKLAVLPEEVRAHFEERRELHEEMQPASFMKYTNSEGETVYLGLNANDEPVVIMKLRDLGDGNSPVGGPFSSQGKKLFLRNGGVNSE
jgi:hypothetical protein